MKIFLFLLLLTTTSPTISQAKYKPTIVVLDPFERKSDSSLMNEIMALDAESYTTPEEEKEFKISLESKPRNSIIMEIAEWEYRKNSNFYSQFSFGLETMLIYAVFGETNNCIVIPSHDTCNGEIKNLKSIAKIHSVTWVVNPISVSTFIKNGKKFTSARIQVYNADRNKILLDREYFGNDTNPGFELSCEEGSFDCTFNNIINQALHDILLTILKRYQH